MELKYSSILHGAKGAMEGGKEEGNDWRMKGKEGKEED
jgi:hypothetical protein